MLGGSATLYATLSFSQPATAVTGNLLVVDSKGKRYKQFPLSLGNVAAGTRAVYKNFKIPASMPSGTYKFIIQLSINGQGLGDIQSNSPLDFLVQGGNPLAIQPVTPLNFPVVLTLNEDFTGGLNRNIWTPGLAVAGEANSAGELQHYTPDEVIPLNGGGLRLRARKRNFRGKNITAGAITSAEGFHQSYGHFEMRAKMAGGPGTWPAFWLLPIDNAWPPEIDIFEYLGRQPNENNVAQHWIVNGIKGATGHTTIMNHDLSQHYHVYAVDWRPNLLVWSIDGVEVHRSTQNVPDQPMYILANLAFGGSWAGPVTSATPFPANFDIAYIRVFSIHRYSPQRARALSSLVKHS